MNKIIIFFKNCFERNGLIKILVAIFILIISTIVIRNTHSFNLMAVFNVIGIASIIYIILTCVVFFIAGIVNSIKDR